jgi:hypothetical protein
MSAPAAPRKRVDAVAASFCVLVGLAWTWIAGMDVNWDLLNYHYYGAHALLNDRLVQDYLPSYQANFNPAVFVPLYLMVESGMPSLALALCLALVHLVNVAAAWSLTRSALADSTRSPWLPWIGALLVLVAPLFLTVLGNSFADAITSIPILYALLLLSREQPRWGLVTDAAIAGLLLGIAGGLKLTNAFLAVTAWLTTLVMFRGPLSARLRVALLMGIGGLAGALATHGYWSYELYRTFANPVFPLFNNIFQSPDFAAVAYSDQRYVMSLPLWEQLLLPVRMLEGESWIYSENPAPDLRPLALLLVMGAAAVLSRRSSLVPTRTISHPLRWMTTYFGISLVAWILVSSNGRYAMGLLLLVGPLLIAWLAMMLRDRSAIAVGLALAAAQVALQAHAGNPRWDPAQWRTPWIDVQVPDDLAARPYTFLLTLNQSHAAIAPWLHPASSLIGLTGQYIQPIGERMPPKLRRRLEAPATDFRVVLSAHLGPDATFMADARAYRRRASMLIPYGFKLSAEDCQQISIRRERLRSVLLPGRSNTVPRDEDPGFRALAVCKVQRADPAEIASVMTVVQQASAIFDRVEAACGKALDPHGSQTAYYYMKPYRNYLNTNRQLVHDTEVGQIYLVQLGIDGKIDLGPGSAWLSDNRPRCPSFPPSHDSGLMP